jgi:Ala-tRNA(Pro) deacylase
MPASVGAATMAPERTTTEGAAMSAALLEGRLAEERVARYELIAHRHTETAADEAAAVGAAQDEVGKTIVLTGDHGFIRVVIPASARLDLRKVTPLIGCGLTTRLATEEELAAAYAMFELGAVPPFGGPTRDVTIVDHDLALRESVIVEAGTHDQSLRIAVPDLIRIAGAQIADICAD